MRPLLRVFTSAPGFAAVAVFTIAVAIGANSALFSVLNAVVLRPLDFPHPDSIVRYWAADRERNIDEPVIFWSKWLDLQANQTVFSHLAVSVANGATVTDGGEPEQVPTLLASSDFLPLLGLTPTLGRVFTAAEDKAGAPHVALISQRLWEQRYGKSPDVLGQAITLDGTPFTIVGVLPRLPVPFHTPDVIHPRPYEVSFLGPNREFAGVWQVTGRLKPGVTRAAAEAQVLDLHRRFVATNPTHPDTASVPRLRPLADEVYGDLNATFWVLAGAVGAVLLIACANLANLALARLSTRRKEIAVRASLGATRADIVRQFLFESLVLAGVGGALGLLVATWSLEGIRLLAGDQLPRGGDIALDRTVLAFTVAVTSLTALLIGLYPAIEASRTDVQVVLKDAGRGNAGNQGRRFRSVLVVAEVALSMVLLICAGLLLASFVKLQRTQLGFDPAGIATGVLNLPRDRYGKPEVAREFYRQLQEKLDAAPELAAGGATTVMPLTDSASFTPYSVHGRPILPMPERPLVGIRTVTTGWFKAMGVRLAAGRIFDADDRPLPPGETPNSHSAATGVCIVNEQLAHKLFPGESALGRTLLFGPRAEARVEIVGVIRNVKTGGVSQPVPDEVYFPRSQRGGAFMTVVGQARPGLAAEAVHPVLRRLVREVDPTLALAQPGTGPQLVRASLAVPRLMMTLLLAFAAIAALLAAVGIYSVMAYSVAHRTGEIGVRIALGATAGNILTLVLRGALGLLAFGLALGLGGAVAATRLLQETLYEVSPLDPLVFAAVSAFFAAVALLACLVPARRALRIDPIAALRAE